jgi:hypothetical protein
MHVEMTLWHESARLGGSLTLEEEQLYGSPFCVEIVDGKIVISHAMV